MTPDELAFLKSSCPYLPTAYISYLEKFCFKPTEQLTLTFTPDEDTSERTEAEKKDILSDKRQLVCALASIGVRETNAETGMCRAISKSILKGNGSTPFYMKSRYLFWLARRFSNFRIPIGITKARRSKRMCNLLSLANCFTTN